MAEQQIQQADVSVYYSFDGVFLADSTGGGNNPTNVNGIAQGAGFIGNGATGFLADGSKYLTINANPDVSPPASFSLSVWFNSNSADGQPILDNQDGSGYILFITLESCVFYALPNANALQTPNGYNLSSWNLLVASYDAATNTRRIRLNNSTPGQSSGGLPYAPSSGPLLMGVNGASIGLAGSLDEVAIYAGKVLTSDEEDWLWNSGSGRTWGDYGSNAPPTPPPPVVHIATPNTPSLVGSQGSRGGYMVPAMTVVPKQRKRRTNKGSEGGQSLIDLVRKQRKDAKDEAELIELVSLLDALEVV